MRRMCAFSVIIGDTIPHVIAYLFPVLAEHAGLRLLVDRRFIIVVCTLAVSFPLSLHRDIVKLSKSSGFGTSLPSPQRNGADEQHWYQCASLSRLLS